MQVEKRKHFPVLLSDEERAKLHQLATAAKIKASDWLREAIAKAYKKQFGDKQIRAGERIKTDPVTLAAKK